MLEKEMLLLIIKNEVEDILHLHTLYCLEILVK